MSFNQSAQALLNTTSQILSDVSGILATLEPGCSFNVDDYSKRTAAHYGVEPLLIATVIRTAVRQSDEFQNKKGRGGGVVHAELENQRKAAQATLASQKEAAKAARAKQNPAPVAVVEEVAAAPEVEEVAVEAEPEVAVEVESAVDEASNDSSETVEDLFAEAM